MRQLGIVAEFYNNAWGDSLNDIKAFEDLAQAGHERFSMGWPVY